MEQQNQIIAVAGCKGSGKTHALKEVLREARRLFVFDTMGDHRWIPDTLDDLNQATIYLMETHSFPEFSGRFLPESDDEDADFNTICAEVYDQGNMLFVVEELPMLGVSASSAPKKFKRIIRLGRHRNLDLIYTCQRLSEVWLTARSQTDVFVLFAHSEPADLEAIEKRCGAVIAQKVAALKGHDFIVYDVREKRELSGFPELFAASPIILESS